MRGFMKEGIECGVERGLSERMGARTAGRFVRL